jgi:hypothetical protein
MLIIETSMTTNTFYLDNRASRGKPSKDVDDDYDTDEDKESEKGMYARRPATNRKDLKEKRTDRNAATSIANYSSENSDEEPFSTLRK